MDFLFFRPSKWQKRVYLYQEPRKSFFSFQSLVSLVPLVLIMVGFSLVVWVLYPIISFEIFVSPRFTSLIRPIPDQVIAQAMENEALVLGLEKEASYPDLDLTKASNWFPQKPPQVNISEQREYTLSIPKLGIEQARVIVGGEALDKSLIQYGGTSLPGEWGKAVIFGHSVLPQFFNPKNYKTIFSTLPKLEREDKILIDFDGITYTYQVYELRVVSPDDVSVLEQRYDSSYLSLVTCVPPGTYWKRLIVNARLKKI